ncbi:MAG TPA: hypothetical protein VK178_11570 [Opitutaceae bacterium]|nr:hypothetical protein [Opitutaceae bacterium]
MKAILALCVLVAARAAFAQSATVSGQPQAVSANYRQDSGISPDASGAATSANYSNRSGYVGQLYDVVALEIAAMPTSVNERATTQLAAGATLDDGTLLVPAPSEVRWTVVSGPVTTIAADGTAAAGNVYQHTSATVRGAYAGVSATLAVTVLNLTSDDFGPYAGDGLPDDWQVTNFGAGNAKAGPTADPDGDGQSNLLECLAGTDPNSTASVFTVRIQNVAGQPARKAILFGPVVAGRTYRVLSSTDLTAASWPDISGALTGVSGELTFIDTAATGARRFYRVQIVAP